MRIPPLDSLYPFRRPSGPPTPPRQDLPYSSAGLILPEGINGASPTDPRNVRSDLDAGDTDTPEAVQTDRQDALCRMLDEFYEASSEAKQRINERAFLSLAFYLGMQYRTWNNADNYLQETRDPSRPYRQYLWANLIRPNITDMVASLFKAEITASVIPDSDRQEDIDAAAQGNDLLAHFDDKFDRDAQSRRAGLLAATSTTCFLFVGWDPTAEADVPDVDEQTGEYRGYVKAPVGDIVERLLDWTKVYPDPLASTWQECRRIMTVESRPLEEVKRQYGAIAETLRADQPTGQAGIVETKLNTVNNESDKGQRQIPKHVTVMQYFELPSKRYEHGLFLTKVGKTLIRDEPFPYEKNDSLPFVPFSFENGQGTLWGLNAVYDHIPMQRLFNRAISSMMEEMRMGPKILIPLNAGIPPDAFNERPFEQIPYMPGLGEPKPWQMEGRAAEWLQIAAFAKESVNDGMGVHNIVNGQPPSGVTAARAINYLIEQSATRWGPPLANLKGWHKERASWEIAHARQNYKEPRMITVNRAPGGPQDTQNDPNQPAPNGVSGPPSLPADSLDVAAGGNADAGAGSGLPAIGAGSAPSPQSSTAQRQVTAFEKLAGGSCRVDVVAASGLPQSPSAKNEELRQMYADGVFGPPGSPEAAELLLAEMEGYGDEVAGRVRRKLEEAAASRPNPAQIEAMKMQAAQQQQQAQLQHEGELEAIKLHTAQQIETIKGQVAAMLKRIPGVTGTLTPTGEVEYEHEALGLEEAKVPPVPKPAGPAKKS